MFTQNSDTNFHRSITYNSQNMEITQIPINNKWINKILYVHMECYSEIRRNGVLTHATTWMILKYMLSEKGPAPKNHVYCMIPFA